MIRNQDVGMLVIESDFSFMLIYDKKIQDKLYLTNSLIFVVSNDKQNIIYII